MRISLVIGLLCAFVATESVQAQARWLQHVEMLATVDDGEPTRVLLDSIAVLAQRGRLELQREPETQAISYGGLISELNREGLDILSANRVFIRYRLEAGPRGFMSTILGLHFIYRPEGFDDVDYPIAYVDAQQSEMRRLIDHGGTRARVNEAVIEPFSDQIAFATLEDAIVVSVGGEIIRDMDEGRRERERLIATIRQLVY
jgi:hypothetical protein